MKISHAVNLASVACATFSPAVVAILGTSCIGAVNSMSKVPGLFLQHVQHQSCAAGCQPVAGQWSSLVKDKFLAEPVEDGAHYVGFGDDTEAKAAFVGFVNQLFDTVREKCEDKLQNNHLCHHTESQEALMDCVDKNSWGAVAGNSGVLVRHMSEMRYKKVAEYLTSDILWEKDFPEAFRPYVQQCHEL